MNTPNQIIYAPRPSTYAQEVAKDLERIERNRKRRKHATFFIAGLAAVSLLAGSGAVVVTETGLAGPVRDEVSPAANNVLIGNLTGPGASGLESDAAIGIETGEGAFRGLLSAGGLSRGYGGRPS